MTRWCLKDKPGGIFPFSLQSAWKQPTRRRDAYYKSAVDFLQDLFLVERHGLSFPLLYPLLLQLFTGVHLSRGPHLTRTHLKGKGWRKLKKKLIDGGLSLWICVFVPGAFIRHQNVGVFETRLRCFYNCPHCAKYYSSDRRCCRHRCSQTFSYMFNHEKDV